MAEPSSPVLPKEETASKTTTTPIVKEPKQASSAEVSPQDSPILVARNTFAALRSPNPKRDDASDDEQSASDFETDDDDETTDETSEDASSDDDEGPPLLPNPNHRPVPSVTVTSPPLPGKGNNDTADSPQSTKSKKNYGDGGKRKSARDTKRYEQKLKRGGFAVGSPEESPMGTPKSSSISSKPKGKRQKSKSRERDVTPDEYVARASPGEPLWPEETRRERREQAKQAKKQAKKDRRAAARQVFDRSAADAALADDPLISVVPLSANSTRFQYKTTGKSAKETVQQESNKASSATPQPQRRDAQPQQQRFDRDRERKPWSPNDEDAATKSSGQMEDGEDSSGLLRPKAPKRRRAQSVIIAGEDPALPSKVLENFVPPPVKPRQRFDPNLETYDSPSSDSSARSTRHFKHLKPMFQPRSPSAWPRRQIGPLKSQHQMLHRHTDRHRGRDTMGSGDYAKMMSGPAKRRHNITHGIRRNKDDSRSSAADEEENDTGDDRSLFLPRSGKVGRKRSHSLIETTPVEEPQDKRKFPLVDIKKIMEEEMERKAEIPVSPHFEEQPPPISTSPDDQTDIVVKRFYVLGDSIAVEEDREHEFKAVQQTKNPLQAISEHCKKYINAFLNTDGGTMYFGVEDDGRLVGVPLDRKTRDMIRLKIDGIVSQNHPQVDPHLISVDFVPVLHPESRAHAKEILRDSRDVVRRFVVEVKIMKGTSPVYTNGDSTAYFRRSGSVYAMGRDMIDQRRKYGRPVLSGNVPDIPRDFVGREDEIAMIRTFATSHPSSLKIVLLHGTPLVGKSSLARQLVLTMSANFPDRHLLIDLKGVSSRYISVEEARIGVIRVVYPLLKMPDSAVEIRGLYESCFAGLRCILLLENAGSLEQVRELIPLTAKQCLMLITSRKDLQLDSELDALAIRLGALNEQNAMKLLLCMAGDRKNDISNSEALEICRLCGFLPLPIRIAGATLSRNANLTPHDLVKQFGDDRYRLELMSNSNFQSAFDLYDPDSKKRLLALSVFPGTFDLEAAAAVLAEELVDAKLSMQNLVELNEVEFDAASGRFSQNDLVRLYCQKRAEESASQLALWQQHFVRHYLRVLLRIVELCDSYIHRKQGVELFSLESHNIEACLALSFKTNNIQVCSRYVRLLRDFAPHMDVPALHKWQQLTQPLLRENPALKELCNAEIPQRLTMSDVYIANPNAPTESSSTSEGSSAPAPAPTLAFSADIDVDPEYMEMREQRPPTPDTYSYTPPPPSDNDEEFAATQHVVTPQKPQMPAIVVKPEPIRPASAPTTDIKQ
eukprot:TRINITY_DN4818_c0_g1_i1.p1 TRINITY_DN4818_c0_g1~~TRINITY_DN4818_c0_g1_i1.p1  ORF type:complete len:1288 (+),score=282.63 TRINITY_DN4818_c0_g1_i1:108-3971(+)